MINVYISVKDLAGAVYLFSQMKREGMQPNEVTYNTMMKCFVELGDPSAGDVCLKPCLNLLTECEKEGLVMGLEGYTSLLSACSNVANLETALEIWSKMTEVKRQPNVFVYTAMISVCLRADEEDKAFDFLAKMKTSKAKPNKVTFYTFIVHFMKKKDRSGAQRTLNTMKSLSVQPDKDTLKMLKILQVI